MAAGNKPASWWADFYEAVKTHGKMAAESRSADEFLDKIMGPIEEHWQSFVIYEYSYDADYNTSTMHVSGCMTKAQYEDVQAFLLQHPDYKMQGGATLNGSPMSWYEFCHSVTLNPHFVRETFLEEWWPMKTPTTLSCFPVTVLFNDIKDWKKTMEKTDEP